MIHYHLDDLVSYHSDKAPFKVVGICAGEIEIEGDFSGGTHNVVQKAWVQRKELKPYQHSAETTFVNLTKEQALEVMVGGGRVRHKHFLPDEHVYMVDGVIYTEENFAVGGPNDNFWQMRGGDVWNRGWSIIAKQTKQAE